MTIPTDNLPPCERCAEREASPGSALTLGPDVHVCPRVYARAMIMMRILLARLLSPADRRRRPHAE